MNATDRERLPLSEYDHVLCQFSGGKDSLAAFLLCYVEAQRLGVSNRLELWHQLVDGAPGSPIFMDWPVTEAYVRATGAAFDVPAYFQWRVGGFKGEMLRENSRIGAVGYRTVFGSERALPPSLRGKLSTRRKFPQVGANLQTRWCSAALKHDVASRVINDQARFAINRDRPTKILYVTGERAEESANRAKYRDFERHRYCDRRGRRVDHWRPVLRYPETEVWSLIERHRVRSHPAYLLGFGRVSCRVCIFGGPPEWATNRAASPELVAEIAGYEREFGATIGRKKLDVIGVADSGQPFAAADDLEWATALSCDYPAARLILAAGEIWQLPRGAFRRGGGPT